MQQIIKSMKIKEITTIQSSATKTPQQQRIASLQRQKEVATNALKAERDRQKIQKAQNQISKVKASMPIT